jgi:glycosyltransferase involved in cell wall biosynthesis
MRVAFYMSEYQSGVDGKSSGGLASYTKNISEALKKNGHETKVLTRSNFERERLSADIRALIDKHFFPAVFWERTVSKGLRQKVNDLYGNKNIDIVQIPEYNGGAAEFKEGKCPLVVRFHTPSFYVDRLNNVKPQLNRRRWYDLEGRGIASADALTSSSSALRTIVCDYYRINPEKVTVIRNPVDTDYFAPRAVKKSEDLFRVLFCGRLEERKGISIIEKMLPDILKKIKNIQIIFAGNDTGRNGIKYEKILVDAAGDKRQHLVFMGHVNHEDLPDLYAESDLFIIPSLFDNSPNSLFEAMSCGLPCIGSRVGGVDEIITDGDNGLLFDVSNPFMLSDYIFELYKDRTKGKSLGLKARNHMLDYYSMKSSANAHIKFYEKVLRGD